MHLNDLSKKMRVVSDESRLKILCTLFREDHICVSDIAMKSDISIATTSHHLQVLQDEGVLLSKREGKRICYTLADDSFVKDLRSLICKYHHITTSS